MIATASHSSSTVSIWWVEKIRVLPRSRISRNAALRSATLTGSRPLNGSSMIRTSGSWRTAAMNWIFCWLPFESSSARRSAYSGTRKRVSQPRTSACGRLSRDAVQAGEEDELLEDLHPRVETALLGQVAERPPRQIGRRLAVPGDGARVRPQDVEHDPHRGRLAGAVRAEEAEDLARLDGEADPVEGLGLAEVLPEVGDLEAHGPRRSRSGCCSSCPVAHRSERGAPGRTVGRTSRLVHPDRSPVRTARPVELARADIGETASAPGQPRTGPVPRRRPRNRAASPKRIYRAGGDGPAHARRATSC